MLSLLISAPIYLVLSLGSSTADRVLSAYTTRSIQNEILAKAIGRGVDCDLTQANAPTAPSLCNGNPLINVYRFQRVTGSPIMISAGGTTLAPGYMITARCQANGANIDILVYSTEPSTGRSDQILKVQCPNY